MYAFLNPFTMIEKSSRTCNLGFGLAREHLASLCTCSSVVAYKMYFCSFLSIEGDYLPDMS